MTFDVKSVGERVYRLAARAPNYLRQFGLVRGLDLLFSVEAPSDERKDEVRAYAVPGYRGQVFLRATRSDRSVFWQCLVRRQYDLTGFAQYPRLIERYGQMVAQGQQPLIVDCGANIGMAAVFFAEAFPEARIVAIEPDADNFAMLKRNVAVYGDRVLPVMAGIASEAGELRIANPGAGAAALRVERAAEAGETTIPAMTIQDVCELGGSAHPFIVKIDIEGFQADLFRQNIDWVGQTHLIAMELEDYQMPWRGISQGLFRATVRHDFDYAMDGETVFCFRHT